MAVKKKAAPREPLEIGLADPGMTPLLRAGLGGLAASLRVVGMQQSPEATWPMPVALAGAAFEVTPRRVRIDWRDADPGAVLQALFQASFRIRKPHGLLDLPGTYPVGAPPSVELAAAEQSALKRTFLQHGKTTTKQGGPRAVSFSLDERSLTTMLQPYERFAHQDGWKAVAGAYEAPVDLAGWAYPGATHRHVALSETKQWYGPPAALCAMYALVGCVSLDATTARAGVLVIIEPDDLVQFAVARPRMSPKRLADVHVGGAGDAVLQVQVALRTEDLRVRGAVRATHAVLLRATAWAPQQKVRVATVSAERIPEGILDAYDRAARELPTRLIARKPKKGEELGYFAEPSALRGFVADNLVLGRPWFRGFATARTAEKRPKYIHYYWERDGLGALRNAERKGLIAMLEQLDDAERALVRSVHTAMRQRFGAIAEEAGNPVTMRNRFKGERERWRLAFAGAKTQSQVRAALADLWSRAGSNRELQASWVTILPLLGAEHWQAARDLALVGLASYGAPKEDDAEADVGDNKLEGSER